ncbi:MAG: GNAT family N-acetyltransferase [Sandaracinus sp.]|nr:GNAT family N-acetyltransferase [Myxococcales bacterium]MCB9604842.1 GNAT family N-acetyltransferase [Sandaracinus sp.]MCB9616411.1 GNAT family N-acetyltransferase [Sandaracinus sp.]
MTSPMIRAARPDDLSKLEALERATFGEGAYPGFFFRQAFDALGRTFFVAEDEGPEASGLAGYVLASWEANATDAWIWSLAVDPSRRGRGHAKRLLDACEAALRDAGATAVRLHVSPTNDVAGAIYAARGYVEVDFVPDAFGPGADRRILRLALR